VPHWFGPARDYPVEILSLLGKQAEGIHVRAAHGWRRTASGRFARNHHTDHQVM
jgi:hypothetical protein